MRKTNLADIGDLLHHAGTVGYKWNQAHEILVNDSVFPEAECTKCTYDISEIENNAYGWSDDSVKIVKTFMDVNNVTEFTLTR
jgi:hypothetical protein